MELETCRSPSSTPTCSKGDADLVALVDWLERLAISASASALVRRPGPAHTDSSSSGGV